MNQTDDNGRPKLTGTRADDPPPEKQPWRFRAKLAAHKYPVHIALAIALAVLTVPVWLLIDSQGDLRESQGSLRDANRQLKSADSRLAAATEAVDGQTEKNCDRIDTVVDTLLVIVTRSKASLKELHAKGAISDPLYRVARRQNAQSTTDLNAAHCD